MMMIVTARGHMHALKLGNPLPHTHLHTFTPPTRQRLSSNPNPNPNPNPNTYLGWPQAARYL